MSDVDYNDHDHDHDNDNENENDNNEEEAGNEERIVPKKGGYDSRVEQWLYENPGSQILITYAGKNLEGGGGYIAYTINTGVWTAYKSHGWTR